jgi:hypothetical protein
MMALVDRALALNPSFARGWYISGTLRWEGGQPDIAIDHAEAALRLSPRGRIGAVFNVIGGALFVSRRFESQGPRRGANATFSICPPAMPDEARPQIVAVTSDSRS